MKKFLLFFFLLPLFPCTAFVYAGPPPTPAAAENVKKEHFVGKVREVNLEAETITAVYRDRIIIFYAASARLKGYETLRGVRKGDKIRVEYEMQKGKAEAKIITKLKGSAAKKEPPQYYF